MTRPIQLACTFHRMAEPFLSGLGFVLQNDPNELEQYCSTKAVYKTQEGFFLWVGFDPLDGRSAGLMCGRSWNYSSSVPGLLRFQYLSNRYWLLARRFGLELSKHYDLDVEDAQHGDLRSILDELESTLPEILNETRLDDLIAIEQENGGAKWWKEQGEYGATVRFEGITPFVPRRRSD